MKDILPSKYFSYFDYMNDFIRNVEQVSLLGNIFKPCMAGSFKIVSLSSMLHNGLLLVKLKGDNISSTLLKRKQSTVEWRTWCCLINSET